MQQRNTRKRTLAKKILLVFMLTTMTPNTGCLGALGGILGAVVRGVGAVLGTVGRVAVGAARIAAPVIRAAAPIATQVLGAVGQARAAGNGANVNNGNNNNGNNNNGNGTVTANSSNRLEDVTNADQYDGQDGNGTAGQEGGTSQAANPLGGN